MVGTDLRLPSTYQCEAPIINSTIVAVCDKGDKIAVNGWQVRARGPRATPPETDSVFVTKQLKPKGPYLKPHQLDTGGQVLALWWRGEVLGALLADRFLVWKNPTESNERAGEISLAAGVPAHLVRWSSDGRWLAVSDLTGLTVYDVESGASKLLLPSEGSHPDAIEWSPDSKLIGAAWSSYPRGVTRIFDAESSKTVMELKSKHQAQTLSWHPDGMRLAVSHGSDDPVYIWNIEQSDAESP